MFVGQISEGGTLNKRIAKKIYIDTIQFVRFLVKSQKIFPINDFGEQYSSEAFL